MTGDRRIVSGGSDGDRPAFVLEGITKAFQSREGVVTRALEGVSFDAPAGAVTCIVGPTGSGKSTLLRIASGLETADQGVVRLNGVAAGTGRGEIAYLTQRHTLFPWMTVRDNVGLPLAVQRVSRAARKGEVEEICSLLGLADALDLYPYELSGGMQQRTALGKLLAAKASCWLLDEPFSAVDERTRHRLQEVILRLVQDKGISVLFVTHSIDEAVFLARKVVVLSSSPGRVVGRFEPDLAFPRNRLAVPFGDQMEEIRRCIEAVLAEDGGG